MEVGVADEVHKRTVRRVINTGGYHYCRLRKKGLLQAADLNIRLDFCKNIRKRKIGQSFWNNHVAIYLDAKQDRARAPSAPEWRNLKKVLKALEDVGELVFKIPPRLPDLNPIKNFFTLVTKTLRKQVIKENIVSL